MKIIDFAPENAVQKEMPNEDNWLSFICGGQVSVWKFYESPEKLRSLSDNGGDEDWIAICDEKFFIKQGGYIPWIYQSGFGACDTDTIIVNDKFVVFIGYHS